MKKIIISLLFISILFTACEWNGGDDNYVEIERPTGEINLSIDLAGVNPEEVILIANGSYLSYSLYSGGHDIIEQKYYLDGVELTNWSWSSPNRYNIYLDGYPQDGKIHELKLLMALKTNTGSLADMVKAEFYVGEYNFKIKFIDRYYNPEFNIRQSLSEDKYLKLEWDKIKDIDIEKYEVYEGGVWNPTLVATINNPDETYYVDKSYHYGYKPYTIKIIVKNGIEINDIEQWYDVKYDIFNIDCTTTELTTEKLKISWNNPNPYPVKYLVENSGNIYPVEIGKNEIEIARPSFPFPSSYDYASSRIFLLPTDADINQYEKYDFSYFYYTDKRISEDIYAVPFLDIKSNTIIALQNEYFYKYDVLNNLELVKTGIFPNNISNINEWYYCAKNKMVAMKNYDYNSYKNYIYIFNDCDFSQVLHKFGMFYNRFCISDTHLIYTDYEKLYFLNMNTGQIDDQKDLFTQLYSGTNLEVSPNAKYLIHYSAIFYTIYELKNNKLHEIKHVDDMSVGISAIHFNPADESQMFLRDYYNRFYIMDIASQKILRTIENNVYLCTDPYTSNVLCYDIENSMFNVLDSTLSKIIFKLKGSTSYYGGDDFILANNILFSKWGDTRGCFVDISE